MADEQQVGDMTGNGSGDESQAGVGALLRKTRVSLGKDMPLVSKELRIRQIYLLAIEEQRYRDLPGRAYAQGFVRGYAEYLGLDGDEIVRRFKQECGAFGNRAELVFPTAVSESSLPSGRLLFLAVVIAVVAYGAWYVYQTRTPSIAEGVPPLPDRLAALIHQPVASGGSEVVSVPRQEPTKQTESVAPVAPTPAQQATAPATVPASVPVQTAPIPATPAASAVPAQPAPQGEEVVPPAEDEQNGQAQQAAPAPSAVQAVPDQNAMKPADAKLSAKAQREAKKAAEEQAKQAAQQAAAKPAESSVPAVQAPAPTTDAVAEKIATVETVRTDATKQQPDVKPLAQDQAAVSSSRVKLSAEQDCWIEIRDSSSGQVVHSRLLRKGESYYVPNRSGLMLTAGNAGAMVIVVDGKSTPPLGRLGMVRRDISLDPDRLNGAGGE